MNLIPSDKAILSLLSCLLLVLWPLLAIDEYMAKRVVRP